MMFLFYCQWLQSIRRALPHAMQLASDEKMEKDERKGAVKTSKKKIHPIKLLYYFTINHKLAN